MLNIKNLFKSKPVKWFLSHSLTITSCVLISGLGIVFLAWSSSPSPTIIGEDITTRNITASGDLRAKTGRTATIIVAASNSSTTSKAQADFIADGADDQVEIQEAINALPAGGGKVLLLEGIYNINTPLIAPPQAHGKVGVIIPSNVTLEGQGEGTILKLISGLSTTVWQTAILLNGSHIKVANLQVDLNGTAYTAGTFYGIKLVATTYSRVSNVLVVRNFYGENISLREAHQNIIAHNVVHTSGGDGIGLTFSNENIVIGNKVNSSNPHGWVVSEGIDLAHDSHRNSIIGNHLDRCYAGVRLTINSDQNLIQGNYILNTTQFGIQISNGSDRNSIISNMIMDPVRFGIYFFPATSASKENTVISNTVEDAEIGIVMIQETHSHIGGNTVRRSTADGIRFEHSHYITLLNNLVAESRLRGLWTNDSTHLSIVGNTFIASSQASHLGSPHMDLRIGSNFILISDNQFRHAGFTNRPNRAIIVRGNDNTVTGNDVQEAVPAPPTIINEGLRNTIHDNRGHITENQGTATFSGTGALMSFTFAHGLTAAPTVVNLGARSAAAAEANRWSADATNITVTFITAPPTGTDNVVIGWEAKVR